MVPRWPTNEMILTSYVVVYEEVVKCWSTSSFEGTAGILRPLAWVMAVSNTLARPRSAITSRDFDSFELRQHGTPLKLQDQSFQILKILVQRPGQLVS